MEKIVPICSQCGETNPSGGRMCKKCGADLPPESDGVNTTSAEAEAPFVERILALLSSGQKIAAVKAYREEHAVGLKDAKDAVEALGAKHGVVSKPAGCSSALLLFGALVVGVVVARWVATMV